MRRAQVKVGSIGERQCRQIAEYLAPNVAYLDLGQLLRSSGDAAALIGRDLPRRTFRPGERIFPAADDDERKLLLLEHGSAEVFFAGESSRALVKKAHAGILLGDMPTVGVSMMGTEAWAAEASTVVPIDLELARALRLALPEWQDGICLRLTDREIHLAWVSLSADEAILIDTLLKLAGEGEIVRGVSQALIAAQLRMTRQSVSRMLASLEKAGLVSLGWKRITLLDTEGLRRRLIFSGG
jgi:CRP-like cAMP-binding protein